MTLEYSETAYRVLLSLLEGEKRYSQLIDEGKRASVAKILRHLIKEKYIKRKLVDAKPPKTFYSITDIGKKLLHEQKEKIFSQYKELISKDEELISKYKTALTRLKQLDKS